MPVFRLLLVDQKDVHVNFYGEAFRPSEIWSIHAQAGTHSIFEAFSRHFEETWLRAEPILDEKNNRIDAVASEVHGL